MKFRGGIVTPVEGVCHSICARARLWALVGDGRFRQIHHGASLDGVGAPAG